MDLDSKYVRDFLQLWLNEGDRQYGLKRNVYPENFEEVITYIKRCIMYEEPAFHGVQAKLGIDKLFWEFDVDVKFDNPTHDSPELDLVWGETMRLVKRVKAAGGKPLMFYSGNRGFHVWVYSGLQGYSFKDRPDVGKRMYKVMLFDILGDKKEYEYFDRVPTNVNSMARIPFSFHQKSGNQVVPIDENREIFYPDLQEYIDNPLDNDFVMDCFTKARHDVEARKLAKDKRKDFVYTGERKIRMAIRKALEKDPFHLARLAFVCDAVMTQMTDDQIHADLSQYIDDYNMEIVQYHIDRQREAVADGMLPPSNRTLEDWGIEVPKKQDITVFDR
jgi:hypothetical protein